MSSYHHFTTYFVVTKTIFEKANAVALHNFEFFSRRNKKNLPEPVGSTCIFRRNMIYYSMRKTE